MTQPGSDDHVMTRIIIMISRVTQDHGIGGCSMPPRPRRQPYNDHDRASADSPGLAESESPGRLRPTSRGTAGVTAPAAGRVSRSAGFRRWHASDHCASVEAARRPRGPPRPAPSPLGQPPEALKPMARARAEPSPAARDGARGAAARAVAGPWGGCHSGRQRHGYPRLLVHRCVAGPQSPAAFLQWSNILDGP